jgi:hypothetical protein
VRVVVPATGLTLLGGLLCWSPSLALNWLRGRELSARDVGVLTLLLPAAALLAVALARRVATSSRLRAVSPLLVLLGLWLLGPVAMLGSATASGGGFAQPVNWGAVVLTTGSFPLTTPMMATYDGSLGGLALASLLLVGFGLRRPRGHA